MTQLAPPPSTTPGGAIKPRYGRITAFGASTLVCGLTFLGGLGVLPAGGSPAAAAHRPGGSLELAGSLTRAAGEVGAPAAAQLASGSSDTATDTATDAGSDAGSDTATGSDSDSSPAPAAGSQPLPDVPDDATTAGDPADHPLPDGSGEGRRVVFDLAQQRVWLVKADGQVRRTYLASGSVTDNLKAGTYEVYSHSEHAVGIDGTTMRWMVRFTRGENAAIGFHDLPVGDDGHPVQRIGDLGTPMSHGCIRQAPGDAQVLWRFAPVGTRVVVTG